MKSDTALSRRGILAAISGVAVTVAPAAANALSALPAAEAVDPIFAAIEGYRRADVETDEAHRAYDEACDKACKKFGPWPRLEDSEEAWDAWWDQTGTGELAERSGDAEDAFEAAIDDLKETTPTTLAGAAALAAFYCEVNPWESEMDWHKPAMRNLADALNRLASQAPMA